MRTLTVELAWRLRKRGLTIPSEGVAFETSALARIVKRQEILFRELAELDLELKKLVR